MQANLGGLPTLGSKFFRNQHRQARPGRLILKNLQRSLAKSFKRNACKKQGGGCQLFL
jgi:hypothetical protein